MASKKKVSHVTTVHPRNDVRIFYKECMSLADAGYEVSLLVADGLGAAEKNGIKIFDIGLRNRNRFSRIIFTQLRMIFWCLKAKSDIYHFHDPELFLLGLVLRLTGARVIFDMHEDIVRQILIKPYISPFARVFASRLYEKVEQFSCRKMSAVIVASDGLGAAKSGFSTRMTSVPNYVDVSKFRSDEKDFGRAHLLHAGALTIPRGVMAMKELALELDKRRLGDVTLIGTLGGGLDAESLTPCQYRGVVDFSEIPDYYNAANIGVILYQPIGQYGQATAVKLYEYMAASIPVLLPNHGDWVALNEKFNIGFCVPVDDTVAQLAAIKFIMSNPELSNKLGKNGRDYVERFVNWEVSRSRLLELYRELLS